MSVADNGAPSPDELAPPRFNRDLQGTRLVFAPGAVLELPSQLERLGLRRAFVITTGGRSASLVPPEELLGGIMAGSFDAAREHVATPAVAVALARFRAAHADVCVAIGGGSAIGFGKAIARESGVPLVAVPTTYSGSEMTSIWGQTDEHGKATGRDPRAKARLVIYDVTLTFGLPAETSAASGMNAMAHAVESMYSSKGTDDTRALAQEAAGLLALGLPAVVQNANDLRARSMVLTGGHLAGRALEETSMGLHHRICHVLGGTLRMPHALTHAALLPRVVAFNAPFAPEAMSQLGLAIGDPAVANALAALNRRLGLCKTLGDLGLREEDVNAVADEVVAKPYPNPRSVSRDDVRALLLDAILPMP